MASEDRTASLCDVHSGRQINILEGHSSATHTVGGGTASHEIVTVSSDVTGHGIRTWDLLRGAMEVNSNKHDGTIRSASLNRAGDVLFADGSNNLVQVWTVANRELQQSLEGHDRRRFSMLKSIDDSQR